jgi:UDP-glucose 4-epimerase
MAILITGGAGYIGSTVTRLLAARGYDAVVFDNLSTGHVRAVPAGVPLVEGDIGDAAALDRVFSAHRIDTVMHFAALIEAGESMKTPLPFFRNNTASALTLLEAMHRHGVDRFVFSSTAALFGDPVRLPIAEDDPLAPTNAYGESKLLVERILHWLHRIHGLKFAALRYFNAAGAASPDHGEAHQPESHLVPLVLQVALGQREAIKIFGTDYDTRDGTCVRDYIHVADLAEAHVLALEALKSRDRLTYNLGNGAGFTVREVIETARKVTGHAIPAVEEARRSGDPATLVASSERIRAELGWTPAHPSLEDIIGSAWEWHRRHPNGYQG